jgi:methylmalonyl-CoA carboxyltransferase large subunit
VGLNLADFVVIAVLVAAGCVLSFVGLWLMLRQAVHELRRATDGRLNELASVVKALEARLAELQPAATVEAAVAPVAAITPIASEKEEITPEMLVVIAAAVTAFLGKKVRIHSAKALHSNPGVANAWSQQGRTLIQASHNLRFRG